ncbi:hypothetical protein BY458DRAFT_553480 [Sporodiniella umbellata]|nr:hypothetical protein BY458DRAFT_553480 [Sporodiniella umbellata]
MNRPATPPYESKRFDLSFQKEALCGLSMPSPPDLFTDHNCLLRKRKSLAPYRSPSPDQINDKSIIFQLDSLSRLPKILSGPSLLWPVRQRVLKARSHPVQRVKPIKIQIVKAPPMLPSPPNTATTPPSPPLRLANPQTMAVAAPRKYPQSGRPSRIKGPCQACHEKSDGCMRKAFNWPFPTDTEFNDKGKPFVYLCNKCGLRYNKSGGCVCRHCRWVLCKEEKRKAMQLIDSMRLFRPDGKVGLDDDIENFVCNPKYWPCGHTWKVGWVLQTQHDDGDDCSTSGDDTL